MKKSDITSGKTPILEDQLGLDTPPASPEPPTEPVAEADLDVGAVPPPAKDLSKTPWNKQRKLWAKLSAGLVALLLLGLAGLVWYGRAQDAQAVSSHWLAITQAAERVTSESARSSYDSFDPATQALADMDDKLSEIQSENKASLLGDKQLVADFGRLLDSFKSYSEKSRDQAGRLADLNDSELDSLKSSATGAKLAVEDFRKTSKVIDAASIPSDFYLLNERFDRLVKAHEAAEDSKKAEADAALSKEEQAKQDKADAEEAASRWTIGYIAGNVADMKKYMTAAFTKEYDFSQVTASYRSTNYPTTYRRVSTDKKSEQYEVVETITFVSKSDYTADMTYTTTYVFLITQDATSKKWLINSQRYQ